MNQAMEQSTAFPVVRSKVQELLTRSPSFRALPGDKRRELAHDMVKIAQYITAGENGDNLPQAVSMAGSDLPEGIPQPGEVAGEDFTPAAATGGVGALGDAIRSVDFPQFVSGLIDGVFNAVVDASIKQMEAYSELVKNVAKSVDQFMKDNVSENQARDYLSERYPDFVQVDVGGQQPRARARDDHDEENLPDFFRELGLTSEVDSLDDDTVEEVLMPAARRRIAMDRQQLLATMVMMGINRIVVTDGKISASVLFHLDTRDLVERGFTQSAEQAGGEWERKRKRRPGFWGWFQPSYNAGGSYGRFKVTTTQEEDSEAEAKLKVDLKGKVDLNFKSETFPLERMTDILVVNEIQAKAPGRAPAPAATDEDEAVAA